VDGHSEDIDGMNNRNNLKQGVTTHTIARSDEIIVLNFITMGLKTLLNSFPHQVFPNKKGYCSVLYFVANNILNYRFFYLPIL
jgi:hypothetical protein